MVFFQGFDLEVWGDLLSLMFHNLSLQIASRRAYEANI